MSYKCSPYSECKNARNRLCTSNDHCGEDETCCFLKQPCLNRSCGWNKTSLRFTHGGEVSEADTLVRAHLDCLSHAISSKQLATHAAADLWSHCAPRWTRTGLPVDLWRHLVVISGKSSSQPKWHLVCRLIWNKKLKHQLNNHILFAF